VRVVRCQKICHGSVVGAELDGRLEWCEHIDSTKLGVKLTRPSPAAPENACRQYGRSAA